MFSTKRKTFIDALATGGHSIVRAEVSASQEKHDVFTENAVARRTGIPILGGSALEIGRTMNADRAPCAMI
jgi:hypothetical protein